MEQFATRIRQILSALPPQFGDTEVERITSEYKKLVDQEGLSPLQQKELLYLIQEDYERARIGAGRSVGIIAGQSIGENATQSNMKAHQTAGVSSSRASFSGFPRINELLRMTQNPKHPTMRIYPNTQLSHIQMREAKAQFQHTLILDLLNRSREPQILPIEEMRQTWHAIHQQVFNVKPSFQPQSWGIRLYIDKYELYMRRLSLNKIATIINETASNLKAIWSSLADPVIDVFTSEEVVEIPNVIDKPTIYLHLRDVVLRAVTTMQVSGIAGLTRMYEEYINFGDLILESRNLNKVDNRDELEQLLYLDKDAMRRTGIQRQWVLEWIRFVSLDMREVPEKDAVYVRGFIPAQNVPYRRLGDIDTRRGLYRMNTDALEEHGITTRQMVHELTNGNNALVVNDSTIRITDENREKVTTKDIFSPVKQARSTFWYFVTDGSNMRLLFFTDGININTTISDDVWQVYQTLGVEAASELLFRELEANIPGVNHAHIQLLVDKLMFYGSPLNIQRHGHKRQAIGFLSKGNFEENLKNLQMSAAMGEVDRLTSIDAAVLTGVLAQIGSTRPTLVTRVRRGDGDAEIEFGPQGRRVIPPEEVQQRTIENEARLQATAVTPAAAPTPKRRGFGIRRG